MKEVSLSSPWAIRATQMQKLFGQDPEIHVTFYEDNNIVKLFVDNTGKAEALQRLLPSSYEFGNVTLQVEVVPANEEKSTIELYKDIFEGNPIFSQAFDMTDIMGIHHNFVLFAPIVAQYYNDDVSEPYSLCNTLYQEIAKEVFGENLDVKFSTERLEVNE